MRKLEIKKNDAGQRLDKFLSKRFKTMPKSLMYKYIRTKYIKLNDKKCQPDVFLNEGDILTFYIKDEFFEPSENTYEFMKASKDIDIIYEDENLLLINKKPGIIVHKDSKYDTDTLVMRVCRYLYETKQYNPDEDKSFTPALVNRIDRNTGGIVIAAKNATALRILNEKIRNREIRKFYLCILVGSVLKKSDTLIDYLVKDENKNKVSISKSEINKSKKIITKYHIISEQNNLSLCEVELLTGRTHQIRAHMAYIGNPLLGDEKYGNKKVNHKYKINKQALYSYKLIFDFKSDGGELQYLNGKEFVVPNVWFVKEGKPYINVNKS